MLAVQAPAIFVDPPLDAGAGAGAGVVAVPEELSEATRAAKLLLLSTAKRFSSFSPSFLRMGHFDWECLLPRVELWQMRHFSDDLEKHLHQQKK